MKSYEELLKEGMKKVPDKVETTDRFEVPKPIVLIQGSKTLIKNIIEIANALRRDQKHLIKFLAKELATSWELSSQSLILIGTFSTSLVNKKIDLYMKSYVICTECKKPDTKITKEDKFYFLKCEACGARHPVSKV
ncbi:MAG: translation initiation factor IF-2 subunit beta [Candidatus Aenigmatarchaeota archaeon]